MSTAAVADDGGRYGPSAVTKAVLERMESLTGHEHRPVAAPSTRGRYVSGANASVTFGVGACLDPLSSEGVVASGSSWARSALQRQSWCTRLR